MTPAVNSYYMISVRSPSGAVENWASVPYHAQDPISAHDAYLEAVAYRDALAGTLSCWVRDRHGTPVIGAGL